MGTESRPKMEINGFMMQYCAELGCRDSRCSRAPVKVFSTPNPAGSNRNGYTTRCCSVPECTKSSCAVQGCVKGWGTAGYEKMNSKYILAIMNSTVELFVLLAFHS